MHIKVLKRLAEEGLKRIARGPEARGDGRCTPGGESSIVGHPLKGAEVPDEKFDAEALAQGILVESEHTDSISLAKAISKAHLLESSDYYEKLAKIEKS